MDIVKVVLSEKRERSDFHTIARKVFDEMLEGLKKYEPEVSDLEI